MQKSVLVTGGLGFIGSHLVERLLGQGQHVTVVDDLSNNAVAPEHFATYLERKQLRWFRCRAESLYEFWFQSPDEIYHLASPVGPAGVLKHAGNIVRQVCDSTYAVMELAKVHSAKLVDVSTSEVYGGGQRGLCREDMPRLIQAETTVRLEYAVAKLALETALINATRVSDLQAVIVRPFNVAGPRQGTRGGFVLPRFVEQAQAGAALTVFGTGEQVRSFTHVTDIVDGLLLAMERGKSGEVYNLGNPANRTTINALAERVIERVGAGHIEHVDPRSIYGALYAEAANKFPDPVKAQRELDWQPALGLTTIIQDMLAERVLVTN